MKLAPREAVMAMVTGVIALYGAGTMLARPQIERWKDLRQERERLAGLIEIDKRVVATREGVAADFGELSRQLPHFPADKNMDIHWLSIMDAVAGRTGVNISKRQAGEEKRVGDIYELPIEGREWESDLSSLLHFLFELQNEGAMLDVRQLYIKPKDPKEKTTLRGRFTLYCAYTRDAATGSAASAPVTVPAGPTATSASPGVAAQPAPAPTPMQPPPVPVPPPASMPVPGAVPPPAAPPAPAPAP